MEHNDNSYPSPLVGRVVGTVAENAADSLTPGMLVIAAGEIVQEEKQTSDGLIIRSVLVATEIGVSLRDGNLLSMNDVSDKAHPQPTVLTPQLDFVPAAHATAEQRAAGVLIG